MGGRVLLARPMPGTMVESRRVTHLIDLPGDASLPVALTARCGARFGAGELELLDGASGMPCVLCLAAPPPAEQIGTSADPAATPRRPV